MVQRHYRAVATALSLRVTNLFGCWGDNCVQRCWLPSALSVCKPDSSGRFECCWGCNKCFQAVVSCPSVQNASAGTCKALTCLTGKHHAGQHHASCCCLQLLREGACHLANSP